MLVCHNLCVVVTISALLSQPSSVPRSSVYPHGHVYCLWRLWTKMPEAGSSVQHLQTRLRAQTHTRPKTNDISVLAQILCNRARNQNSWRVPSFRCTLEHAKTKQMCLSFAYIDLCVLSLQPASNLQLRTEAWEETWREERRTSEAGCALWLDVEGP